jgi:hypothetical protein
MGRSHGVTRLSQQSANPLCSTEAENTHDASVDHGDHGDEKGANEASEKDADPLRGDFLETRNAGLKTRLVVHSRDGARVGCW